MKTFGKNMWSWSDNDHIFWGVLKGAGVVWELGVGVGVVGVGVVGAGLGSGSWCSSIGGELPLSPLLPLGSPRLVPGLQSGY